MLRLKIGTSAVAVFACVGRLDVLRGHRFEALYVCALTVGLRRGELLGLRRSHIDFDPGTLTVRQTVQRADGRLQMAEPKTTRSRRTVPVPAQTLALFRAHRRQRSMDRLALGERWQDHGPVFPSKAGSRWTRTISTGPGTRSARMSACPENERAGVDEAARHLFG
ncbi:hypothetical protein [Micromonospora sp. NPDC049679]|uniref:hypothetical protein n=1 Tax=Micromonospora sp. NPDC049679 TaxID=3155920 RepID=UPI0034019D76